MLQLFPSLSLEFSLLIPSFLFCPQDLFVCRMRNPSVRRSQWRRLWQGGGARKGHLQISSINHPTHSNVTNILQLEETRRSSKPSISLIPHDHRFIRPCLRAEQTHIHRRTTLKLHVNVCETVWWALWHGVSRRTESSRMVTDDCCLRACKWERKSA